MKLESDILIAILLRLNDLGIVAFAESGLAGSSSWRMG
jgi:hypothetical protein